MNCWCFREIRVSHQMGALQAVRLSGVGGARPADHALFALAAYRRQLITMVCPNLKQLAFAPPDPQEH